MSASKFGESKWADVVAQAALGPGSRRDSRGRPTWGLPGCDIRRSEGVFQRCLVSHQVWAGRKCGLGDLWRQELCDLVEVARVVAGGAGDVVVAAQP